MIVCFWQEEAQMMYVEDSRLNKHIQAVDGATPPLSGRCCSVGLGQGLEAWTLPLFGHCSASSQILYSLYSQAP